MSRGHEGAAGRGAPRGGDPKRVPLCWEMVPKSCSPHHPPQALPVNLGSAFPSWLQEQRLGLAKRISTARALPNSSSALAPRTAPPAWLQKLGEKPAFLSKSSSARSRASSGVININRDDAHQFQPGCREGMLGLRLRNYVNLVDYPFMCFLPGAQRRDAGVGSSSGCGRPLPAPP